MRCLKQGECNNMVLKITLIGLLAGVLGTGLGGVLSGIFKKKIPVIYTIDSSTIQSEYKSTGCIGYIPQSGSVYRVVQYPESSSSSPKGSVEITLSDNANYLYIQKNFSDASQNLFESGLLDSMATVSLLLGLQDAFGVQVPVSEFDRSQWDTIEKIEERVKELQNA